MSVLYTNAILSVRSARLLNNDRIRRMIASSDVVEATKILFECGWDEQSIANFRGNNDEIISAELKRITHEFKQLCPDPRLEEIILAKLAHLNSSDVDIATTRDYYAEQLVRLGKLRNRAITNYFKAEIDLLNMRTFGKLRLYGGKPDGFFVEGGTASEVDIMAIFGRDMGRIRPALSHLGYSALLDKLIDGLTIGNLAEFENASNAYLVKLSREGAEDSFKLNMLFGWFVAKLEELRIVKTILTGKKFGKSRDELRDGLKGVL